MGLISMGHAVKILVLSAALVGASGGFAVGDETPSAALQVGIKLAPPFVMKDESTGQVTGFSIDLMRHLAAQLDPPRQIEFQMQQSLADHLDFVRDGKVDLGISATSITATRERTLDFSVPFHQSGLDIAVREGSSSGTVWATVGLWNLAYPMTGLLVFVILCAHIIWLTERGKDSQFDNEWIKGVSQAIWWTLVTMTTVGYGDFVPTSPASRAIAVSIIVVGIVLFGIAVGVFSSALTIQELATDVQGPADLQGKSVMVVRDTIAVAKMKEFTSHVVEVESLEAAVAAVRSEKAFAVVHDSDQLRHYFSQTSERLILVNRPFAMQHYAIAFPSGSALRETTNIALLELMDGEPSLYAQLHNRWFGSAD